MVLRELPAVNPSWSYPRGEVMSARAVASMHRGSVISRERSRRGSVVQDDMDGEDMTEVAQELRRIGIKRVPPPRLFVQVSYPAPCPKSGEPAVLTELEFLGLSCARWIPLYGQVISTP